MSNRSHNVSRASHSYVCLRARAANVALYVLSKSENEATLNRFIGSGPWLSRRLEHAWRSRPWCSSVPDLTRPPFGQSAFLTPSVSHLQLLSRPDLTWTLRVDRRCCIFLPERARDRSQGARKVPEHDTAPDASIAERAGAAAWLACRLAHMRLCSSPS